MTCEFLDICPDTLKAKAGIKDFVDQHYELCKPGVGDCLTKYQLSLLSVLKQIETKK